MAQRPNVDPAPLNCGDCGSASFNLATRVDRHSGRDMGWKNTPHIAVVACSGCGVHYGYTAPHPHREQVWQRLPAAPR